MKKEARDREAKGRGRGGGILGREEGVGGVGI